GVSGERRSSSCSCNGREPTRGGATLEARICSVPRSSGTKNGTRSNENGRSPDTELMDAVHVSPVVGEGEGAAHLRLGRSRFRFLDVQEENMGIRDSTFSPRFIGITAVALFCVACGDDIVTVTSVKPPCFGLCTTALSPTKAIAGSGDLTLSVAGSGFIQGSWVHWASPDGGPTRGLSATVNTGANLTTIVPADLLALPGIA